MEDGYLSVEIGNGSDDTKLNYIVVASADDDGDGDDYSNEDDACPFAYDPG